MPYQPKPLIVHEIKPRPILEDITIVIPTLGREILEESLYWIVVGSAWPGGLIIVDQGLSSTVEIWIKRLQSIAIEAEYLPSSQHGRAAGINRGLECVKTRFVAITDDDCFVDTDWLERITACLYENPEAIVTGRVEPAGNEVFSVVTSRIPAIYYRPRLKFDSMSGGNMGTSTKVIEKVGLFDEHPSLRTAEDGEWAYRALRSKVPIIYNPDVVVRHFGWRDNEKRSVQYNSYARSHGGFYGKYLRKGDWFIALRAVLHYLRSIRWWVWGVMNGDPGLAQFGRAYITGLLPGIIAGMRRRKAI